MSYANAQAAQDKSGLALPEMSESDFARVSERVEAMAGIVLEDHKRQMILSRLSRRLRALEMDSISAYLDRLDREKDPVELQEFVNTLTTNLTSFFREMHHFTHLDEHVLRPKAGETAPRLRIWSAGCSSGEEPYSIALTILGQFGKMPADARILATDLDTNVLARARRGIYPADRCGGLDPQYDRLIGKPTAEGERAMPAAAVNAIAFRQLNLLESWPMKGPFDAIFCRNVMIYFSQATKARLIDRFADILVPGGFLYLGHSESILGKHPVLRSCGETVYQKDAAR